MRLGVNPRGGAVKQVVCNYCGKSSEVARRAMSIFCPHCHKRLILEDYKIATYYAVREFYTCGEVVVEKGGQVVAGIRAATLTVKGVVQGNAEVRGLVKLTKTGSFKGELSAPSLAVEAGGKFDGFVRIGPLASPQ
ncbi:MAG: polymer-forming cytoskeletal protein [Planctomycetota bacterium]